MIERLPKPLHASARRALRQAWELNDAKKAERLLRNLTRRLDQAYEHLPVLRAALAAHQSKYLTQPVEDNVDAA